MLYNLYFHQTTNLVFWKNIAVNFFFSFRTYHSTLRGTEYV